MTRKHLGCCLLVFAGLLHVGPAAAISLGFQPSDSVVDLNGSVAVDVVVTGLSGAAPGGGDEVVSSFDLDVLYDPGILDATGVIFGTELGANPSPDPFDIFADALIDSVLSPGRIDFAELSYLLDFELAPLQDDDVLLATLTFDAIGVGVSSLVFDANTPPGVDVKNGFADRLQLDVGDGSVTVRDVAVIPIPGAAILMLTGLFGIGVFARKRKAET